MTLYLARAIHGANTAAPPIPENTGEYTSTGVDEGAKEGEEDVCLNAVLKPQAKHEAYDKWRANRRAVIHTLDISERHSAHAQITLKNFREGMYFPNVDFHVGTIHGYISGRLTDSPEPFFDHAILDLPNTQDFMEIVSKALKPNGTLITFCPSVTQINACLLMAKDKGIPFFMERVLEFGCAIGVGGREWDVRLVKPRQARQDCHICNVGVPSLKPDSRATWQSHEGREASEHKIELDASDVQTSSEIEDNPDTPEALPLTPLPEEQPVTRGWEMVCRPKVGGRVAGGGFLGVWRRKV